MSDAPSSVWRLGDLSVLYSPRAVRVTMLLLVALTLLLFAHLATGQLALSPAEVWQTLTGRGTVASEYAVYQLRMPRALTGIGVGLALGAAGAAFQVLTRNPLGSPDVIGFTAGSATGALVGVMVLGGGQLLTASTSLAGGLGAATLVYGLARKDAVNGYRLILLGIGVSAVMTSINAWLITRAELGDALAAQVWLTGTLAARGWEHVIPLGVVVVLLVPLLAGVGRPLALWSLGADTAGALGLDTERTRLKVVALGVILVSAATTAAGPIAFVALTAPHVARLLTRGTGVGVLQAALTGACLVLASDVLGMRISDGALPVGVVTSALGGTYLAWLLARAWKDGRG